MAIAPQAPAALTPEDLTTIDVLAKRLVGHFGYTEQDREDVRHDLVVDLLERLQGYNPEKAKRSTFVKDCVEHQISNMIRARGRQCRDPRRISPIGDCSQDCRAVSPDSLIDHRSQDAQDLADLRMDVASVIARLPQRQQDICALLADHSAYAISQRLGRPKREVYQDVQAIRAAFAAAGLNPGVATPGKQTTSRGK
ncbi:hypothetical protein LBMAG53_19990 [Planctomycetota bacterium]|nr:hypothetical protein LBMAG53_19990 [Planctomycetota bacterium]